MARMLWLMNFIVNALTVVAPYRPRVKTLSCYHPSTEVASCVTPAETQKFGFPVEEVPCRSHAFAQFCWWPGCS